MITFTVYKNKSGQYKGFDCKGHAGYAESGHDIICAGVSALVINTINSIESFTTDDFTADSNEEQGIFLRLTDPGEKTTLLLDSLVLGMEGIKNDNDGEYIKVIFREV